MLVQIAWRNLWRNRRRTLLTVAAIAGGLFMMMGMYALMRGMSDRLLESLTGSYMGHVQIHHDRYREDQQFTLTVTDANLVLDTVRSVQGVKAASGRIMGFAHASFVRGSDQEVRSGGGEEVASPVIGVLAVDPENEVQVTDLEDKIREGRWLQAETDVIIGDGIAQRYNIEIGDAMLPTTISSTGAMQGPWAVSDQVPRVAGIVKTGVEDVDSGMVLMSLSYFSQLVRFDDQLHEITIRADDPGDLDSLVVRIREAVSEARSSSSGSESFPSTEEVRIGLESSDGTPPPADSPSISLIGVETVEQGVEANGFLQGQFLRRAEDIVLPQQVAQRLGVSIGGRVSVAVPIDCGEGVSPEECPPTAESFIVSGTYEPPSGMTGIALVSAPVVNDNILALAPQLRSQTQADLSENISSLLGRLRGERQAHDEILGWKELAPELAEIMQMMEVSPIIFLIIIYIAVMLGIVNTMLMATFERMRELGIMRAIGMRPFRVVSMVLTESALLAGVGSAVGLLLSFPLVFYWSTYGLDMGGLMDGESFDMAGVVFDSMLYPKLSISDVAEATLAVFIMSTFAGLWPALRAARVQPTEALRHD